MKHKVNKISLPALRGKIGDWFYYITILTFEEVGKRVFLPKEIDKYNDDNKKLGDWIQRELEPERTKLIVEYLNNQPQRFFNSLILGIYGGSPSWQEININDSEIDENTLEYLSSTIGILNLNGDEDIFAIDGQHRAISIREAVKENPELAKEEVSAIFVAHRTDNEGIVRTRRLFSTLNRYAKPVNQMEIIALSEDDNCAIITRWFAENFPLFVNKILLNKQKVISPENTTHFSNMMVLYDGIKRLIIDEKVYGIKVNGRNKYSFLNTRLPNEKVETIKTELASLFTEVIKAIPSLNHFFSSNIPINRSDKNTSLLFRPIGQNMLFDVLKVAIDYNKKQEAISFFSKDNFNLSNPTWEKIFWDKESGVLFTDKSKQKFATLLILEHIGIGIKRTNKDLEVFNNYKINPKDL